MGKAHSNAWRQVSAFHAPRLRPRLEILCGRSRAPPGRKNHNRFEINGSAGSLAFDLERLTELELYLNSDPAGLKGFSISTPRAIVVGPAMGPGERRVQGTLILMLR